MANAMKKKAAKSKATTKHGKLKAAPAAAPTHAYSIYQPVEGHSFGTGSLADCKAAVKKAYPDVELLFEEATGRWLGQKDGGNVATIVLTPTE